MRLRFWLGAFFILSRAAEAVAVVPGGVLATFRDLGSVVAADQTSLVLGKPNAGVPVGAVNRINDPLSTAPTVRSLTPNRNNHGRFGVSVAASAGQVLIGDTSSNGKSFNGGFTLYDVDDRALVSMVAPQPIAIDQGFGTAVAFTDEAFAVGVPYWDGDAGTLNHRGVVQLYDSNGSYKRSLDPPTQTELASFGYSLAGQGEQLLVGAPDDDSTAAKGGAAYLYTDEFELRARFSNPTPSVGDRFGQTLAISEDRVLVGAPYDDAFAKWSGAAYLFDLEGNLLQTFNNPAPSFDDEFGSAVSFVGDNLLIGAQREDAAGYDNGAAYLFSPDGRLLNTLLPPPLADRPTDIGKRFGSSLTSFAGHIVAGAGGVASTFVLAGGSLLTPLGDANVDGQIGLADFGILKESFGKEGTMFEGDFDSSGTVDLVDFGRLKENFGKQLPVATTAVPEPTTALLAMLGALPLAIRRWRSLVFAGAGILSLFAANSAPAADYMYVPFTMPGATETSLYGINELGSFTGSFLDQAGVERGFVVNNNVPLVLEFPGAASTVVLGLNDAGVAVGGYTDAAGKSRPFIWDGPTGQFRALTLPEGYTGIAAGINNSGDVVGLATNSEVVDFGFRTNIAEQSPVVLETTPLGPEGTPTIYNDINSDGVIVGEYRDAKLRTHGIFGSGSNAFDLPLATKTTLNGLNDRYDLVGIVSGTVFAPGGPTTFSRGFVYSNLLFEEIAFPGAELTVPSSISNNGTIVGLFETALHRTGFMAVPIEAIRGDLNSDGKVDLSDFGILKENFGKSGVAAVPEPSGWLLVCLGAATFVAFKRPPSGRRPAA